MIDRQVLYAHRTLEFAAAARGALEGRLFADVLAQQRRFVAGAEFVEVVAHPQNDLFRVEHLSRVGGRTVLGAAPALHAREGLQRVDARDVLAGVEAEILVAGRAAESG